MQENHTNLIGRRPVLKGAGVALAGLGGLTGSALAKGSKTPLTDRAADIVVYWSEVATESNDPDAPTDFQFADPKGDALPPGGPTLAAHDPAGGGAFDFSNIVMMPNGDLKNRWLLLGGAIMKTPPKPYRLVHNGGGVYQSVGQHMEFQAKSAEEILAFLNAPRPEDDKLPGLPPALAILAGGKWRAIGLEYAQLDMTNGKPDPSKPEWGATRIDIYDQKSREFTLSLVYLIGADDDPGDPSDGIKPAVPSAIGLIQGGRLPLPGQ